MGAENTETKFTSSADFKSTQGKCKRRPFELVLVVVFSIALSASYIELRLHFLGHHNEKESLSDIEQDHFSGEIQSRGKHLQRERRSSNESEYNKEREHEHQYHQGIGSARIAALYGDETKLSNSLGEISPLKMMIGPNHYPVPYCLNGSYSNGFGDEWCRRPDQPSDIYMITGRNYDYRYFSKASWMNRTESSEYYTILDDVSGSHGGQKIQVNHPGLYIIASNMHFTVMRASRGIPMVVLYGIYMNNATMNNERKVGSCSHVHKGTRLNDGSKVVSCPTWQLVRLLANDVVYMKIWPYQWFEVKDTMHLTLINLNDDVL